MNALSEQENRQKAELFHERLDNMLNLSHKFNRLAGFIDWQKFEHEFGALYSEKKGRPGIPIRLLVGLSYLAHAYGLSDQAVVESWVENPNWRVPRTPGKQPVELY